jgi:hypothetical protein
MKAKYLRLANAILALVRRGKRAGPAADEKSPKRHFRVLYHRVAAARPGK